MARQGHLTRQELRELEFNLAKEPCAPEFSEDIYL